MRKTLEQKMCKRSLGYALFKNYIARPAFFLFYKKIDVVGVNEVPDEGPVIFTPNHQNALMDALAILFTKNRQIVFLARADIFKKPFIISILHFFRILPIFRKRDGGISAENNQETFDMILKVLESGNAVGIMPEGMHNKMKRLQMLQKGVFRLALQAQEKYGATPMIKIIPVGIEFTNTYKFRSSLIVNYGKAIEVSDFYNMYVENSAKAYKQMQDTLTEKIKEGMVDITNDQHYNEIERLRVLYLKRVIQKNGLDFGNAEHRLQMQQKIIAVLQEYAKSFPDEMNTLCIAVEDYFTIIEKNNQRDWVIERQPYSFVCLLWGCILALIGFPFWILGMLFNYLPYKMSALASSKVKDPQFITSVQYVASLAIFPLYYLIAIVLLVLFIPCFWGKLIMPMLMFPLGLFAFKYYILMKKLCARFRFCWGNKKEFKKAIELRKTIFEKMDYVFEI